MIEIFPIKMSEFNEERLIRVYLPYNYHAEDKRFPVLYMHDGQNVFDDREAIGGVSLDLERYLDENRLEVIVVAIDQNSEERINEYCPWVNGAYAAKLLGKPSTLGGKGKQYTEFIVNELKPLIDHKYRTSACETAMAGISLGGLISTYAACCYPEIFQHIIALSSGFYRNQEEIEKLIQQSDLNGVKSFYLDCGTKEGGDDQFINEECVKTNESVFRLLKDKVSHLRFKKIDGDEHNYSAFRKRVPELFSFLKSGNPQS